MKETIRAFNDYLMNEQKAVDVSEKKVFLHDLCRWKSARYTADRFRNWDCCGVKCIAAEFLFRGALKMFT